MNCNPIPNLDLFLKIPVMFWAQNQIFKSKSIEYKAQALPNMPVHFVLFSDSFVMLPAKLLKPLP